MNYYKVDIEKLKYRSDFYALLGCISVPEDYEHLDKVKKFLDIPEDSPLLHKTTDERFDPRIAYAKIKFSCLESRLDDKFKKFSRNQDEAFEFAKRYGHFPRLLIATNATVSVKGAYPGELCYDPTSGQLLMASEKGTKWVSLGNSGWSRCNDKDPNPVVKWFAKVFLGLHWQPSPSI